MKLKFLKQIFGNKLLRYLLYYLTLQSKHVHVIKIKNIMFVNIFISRIRLKKTLNIMVVNKTQHLGIQTRLKLLLEQSGYLDWLLKVTASLSLLTYKHEITYSISTIYNKNKNKIYECCIRNKNGIWACVKETTIRQQNSKQPLVW